MKKLFSIFLLFFSIGANAQYLAPLDAKNSGARSVGILVTDSMQNMRYFDTTTCKLAFPSKLAGRIARQNGRLYYNPTGTKFVLLDSVVASGSFDTTNIYDQLALRVRYSDTAAMLSPYATDAELALKLNITDTANIRLRPIAGANMTITGTYPNLTFAASGGGGTVYDSVLMATQYRLDTVKANRVPYVGATSDVLLGSNGLSAYDLTINYTSGSGTAASITKGGNGEALTVVKSSGTGNAASITGGVTLLDELHLNTDLADAYISSASTWNAKIGASDTAAMLTPYLRDADTTAMLANYVVNGLNGLTKSGKNLTLGGSLTGATTITTTGSNTLAISGLTSGTTNDSLVVADPSTGALKRISSSRISGGGSTSPAGSNTQVQYNNSGSFGASSDFIWDNTKKQVKISNTVWNTEGDLYLDNSNSLGPSVGFQNGVRRLSLLNHTTKGLSLYDHSTGYYTFEINASSFNTYKLRCDNVSGGTGLELNSENTTGGGSWTLLSSGSGLGLGAGKFGIYSPVAGYVMAITDAGNVGFGTTSPNASALLDVSSTTKGFLPPRMTGTQADAIASKAEGLMVYVTDTSGGFAAKGWYGWNGAAWEKLNP